MLQRFKARGYKSLVDIDVPLSHLTVIFGPNAAGKSNLLDAIGLLSRMVTSENLDDAFRKHRGTAIEAFSFPDAGLPGLLNSPTARFSFEADIEVSEDVAAYVESEIAKQRQGLSDRRPRKLVLHRRLRYRLEVEILTDSGHLRVRDEHLEALKADGSPDRGRAAFISKTPEGRLALRHEGQGHPTYEDLGQDRAIASKRIYPPHYPHVFALREELSRWRTYFLEPSVMRSETALKEVNVLPEDGSDLAAFYNTLLRTDPKRFDSFQRSLGLIVSSAKGIHVSPDEQGLVRLEVDESGVPMSARIVSEGTLRVLGLLAIANPTEPLSLVGYEEPENGVHATRLSMVARFLSTAAARETTQFIINTHSPYLPQYFLDSQDSTIIGCHKSGRSTVFSPFDRRTLFSEGEIDEILDEGVPATFSERLVRGDFS